MAAKWIRVLVGTSDSGTIYTQDAVQNGDELWLVPSWMQSPDGTLLTPAVAIRVDSLGVQELSDDPSGAEALLQSPVPTAALQGDLQAAAGAGLQAVAGPIEALTIRRPSIQ